MRYWLFSSPLFCCFVILLGCQDKLDQAFADVRAASPKVCTDYCEAMISCEWTPYPTGDFKNEAYSASIRGCITNCAWYMNEGAFFSAPP